MNTISHQDALEQNCDLLFLDTEFSSLPETQESLIGWASRVELLSVGITAADHDRGVAELYCVREMTSSIAAACSPFAVREVLPLLHAAGPGMLFDSPEKLARLLADYFQSRSSSSEQCMAVASEWIGDLLLLDGVLSKDVRRVLINQQGLDDPMMVSGALRHHSLHDARDLRRRFLAIT